MRRQVLNPIVIKKMIDRHKKLHIPFTITISNYTTKIESKVDKVLFLKNEQSNRMFSAYAKIKAEVVKKKNPMVDAMSVNYFFSKKFDTDFYADLIFNCDLRAAYASILFNEEYISSETYKYIMSLKKQERLACVGMLASKKSVFEIDENGTPVNSYVVVSELAGYFFHCVKRTNEIMLDAANLVAEDFLFTWVDGIYFLGEFPKFDLLNEYFKQINFNVTNDILQEFHLKIFKNFYATSFLKDGKRKTLNVPREDNSLHKKLVSYLLTKDYN